MFRKQLFIGVVFLVTALPVLAQVELGVGAELGAPLMFNGIVKGHNHASGAPGVRVTASYTPKDASFTGSLVAGFSPMILPVVRFNNGQDVLYMNFTNTNLSLFGRFRKEMKNDAVLLFGPGVGVNMLNGNRVQISKRSEVEINRVIEDSSVYNKTTVPSFYINIEYMHPLGDKGWQYSIGAQLHYIYFLDQGNTYRVDIIDEQLAYYSLQPELTGHMLNPMVFVNLYYRLGSR